MAFIGDSLDVFVRRKDERLNFAVRHQHHKSAGADFAFGVKVDLTVEVLTIFGEDDASAIFLGNDAGDHVAVQQLTFGTNR